MGLFASAGAGLSLRDVPASNGTSVTMSILQIGSGIGFDVTDRLSAGATVLIGSSTLDAPFVGIGAAAYAYQLHGSLGVDYDLTDSTNIGFYYQSRQNFNYDDAIQLALGGGAFTPVLDVNAGLPDNIGLGFANNSLVDGRLLLAMDVLYKQWDTADLFNVLYENQWVVQLGAQYEHSPRLRLRAGYAYAENPLDGTLAGAPGGVILPGPPVAALQYVQGTVAVTSHHRISAGVGLRDLLPGIEFDVFAGGMFRDSQQLGPFTATSI